ncbi:MAG: NAD(P)H-quinone oxidoreductase [Balneolaceae bacterium]
MKVLLVDNSSKKTVMVPGEYPLPFSNRDELLVKVKATALNRADLMQKAGNYPPPNGASPILGLEMSGIVEKTGEDVSRFKQGDRVYGLLSGGGYAEYCTIHQDLAMKIPEDVSFEEAAAIPEVFLTAYLSLIWLGGLKKGETVLIHAGASGVGTAAIQIASELRQARVITTTGSDDKCSLTASLGSDLCINYNDENYADSIQETFGENCVNLIIDFVGSPYWDLNMDVLAMDGRVVYLSFLGGTMVERMSLVPILRKRLTIKGSTLRNRSDDYKIRLTSDFDSDTTELFKQGKLKPIIDSIYDWLDVEDAHSRMKNNQNAGKIVLTGM